MSNKKTMDENPQPIGELTMRDHFAMAALMAPSTGKIINFEEAADWSYAMANAMMIARQK